MREIIMMLERELSNDGLIYIYRESDGKWYAYEQSAFYLCALLDSYDGGNSVKSIYSGAGSVRKQVKK